MACWIFQVIIHLAITLELFPLITSSNTTEYDHQCFPMLILQRNTVWRARVMDTLKINCTLVNQCQVNLSVIWCKFHVNEKQCEPLNKSQLITTELRNFNESFQMSFLTFKNISRKDSGKYRCELSTLTSVPHPIIVNVTEIPFDNKDLEVRSKENSTNGSDSKNTDPTWLYLYIASGVVLMVIIVLVLVIRCRVKKSRKSRLHGTAPNQTTETQIAELFSPALDTLMQNPSSYLNAKSHNFPAQVKSPSPCIYDNVPLRVASRRHRLSPPRLPAVRSAQERSPNHGKVKKKEDLVYASLNHEAAQQRPARVNHTMIETSEYAAIKVS